MTFHPPSELILNPDGSIYHLKLKPHQIAPTIILVGDQERVDKVSRHFDQIMYRVQSREFKTHTGVFKQKPISVISTGIGTDNIDIVMNEIDALFNIDLETRQTKQDFQAVDLIRIGTSGALLSALATDTSLISSHGLGLEGLMHYYDFEFSAGEKAICMALKSFEEINFPLPPYIAAASDKLVTKMGAGIEKGITVTCPGFYAPQGRQLRGTVFQKDYLSSLRAFNYNNHRITNFEMETAGIYGMARMLGHEAISFNAILANRESGAFSDRPKETVEQLIELVLNRI